MAIALPVVAAVNILSISAPAFNTIQSVTRGRTTSGPTETFTLRGSIQFATDKQVQLLGEGFESGGTVIVRTRQTLFYLDNDLTGREVRQTFFEFYDERWRVVAERDQRPYGGYRKYLATKFIDRS